jgi:type III pantothenate kinase
VKVLVDIGNTRLKYCQVVDNFTMQASSDIKAIHVSSLNVGWLDQHWKQAKIIIIGSVNQPALLAKIITWAEQNNIVTDIVTSEQQAYGVISGYLKPECLGVDRWLAIIGARQLYPEKNLIIVDAGTATTVDVVNAHGQHLGGWIFPGIDCMHQSVLKNTAQVEGNLKQANLAFANNTEDNVNNACWAATIGLIKVAVEQINKLNLTLDNIILTGGNTLSLSKLLDVPHQCHEELIFYGLQSYAKSAI